MLRYGKYSKTLGCEKMYTFYNFVDYLQVGHARVGDEAVRNMF